MLVQKAITLISSSDKGQILKQQCFQDKRESYQNGLILFSKQTDLAGKNLAQAKQNKNHLKVNNQEVYRPSLLKQEGLKKQMIFNEKVESLIQEKLKLTVKKSSNIDKFIIKNNKQSSETHTTFKTTKSNNQIKVADYFSEPSKQRKRLDLFWDKENKVERMNQMGKNQPNFKKVKANQKQNQMTFFIN